MAQWWEQVSVFTKLRSSSPPNFSENKGTAGYLRSSWRGRETGSSKG